jgi:hypothetical protein
MMFIRRRLTAYAPDSIIIMINLSRRVLIK